MKPTLKSLALFEAYGGTQQSGSPYTKAIGLYHHETKELAPEIEKQVKAKFNAVQTAADIARDAEVVRTRAAIEEFVVSMLSTVISEGDKKQQPIEIEPT